MAYQIPAQSIEHVPEDSIQYNQGTINSAQACDYFRSEFNMQGGEQDGFLDLSELTASSGDTSDNTAKAFLDIFDQPDPSTGKPDGNINLPEYTVYKMVQDQADGSLDGVINPEKMEQINSAIPNPDPQTRQSLKDQAKSLFAIYFNPQK
jgi:hypothetical protein